MNILVDHLTYQNDETTSPLLESLWATIQNKYTISVVGGHIKLYTSGVHLTTPSKMHRTLEEISMQWAPEGVDVPKVFEIVKKFLTKKWARVNSGSECVTEFVRGSGLDSAAIGFLENFIRWSTGRNSFCVRLLPVTYNLWELTSDPWGVLCSQSFSSGQSFGQALAEKLLDLQKSGKTTWGVDRTENDDGTTDIAYSTLGILVTQERKFITQLRSVFELFLAPPSTFTNDPNTPASCFFPLKDLPETSSVTNMDWEAWGDFETQMPTWAVPVWRAIFYGVFDDKNRSRQMVVLYDDGGTGKSNMIRAIAKKTCGQFYAALSKDSLSNQFWGSKIFGRRLVFFSDTGNTKISQMDKVKQISGGDPLDVEFKGISGQIPYVPNLRVVITSNQPQKIVTYHLHQLSRVIIIPMERTKDTNILKKYCALDEEGNLLYDYRGEPRVLGAKYDDWMAEQLYAYLAICKPSYDLLCPTRQDVRLPDEAIRYILSNCISQDTAALEFLFDRYIVITKNKNDFLPNSALRILTEMLAEDPKNPTIRFEELSDFLRLKGATMDRTSEARGFSGIVLAPGVSITGGRVKKQLQPTPALEPAEGIS